MVRSVGVPSSLEGLEEKPLQDVDMRLISIRTELVLFDRREEKLEIRLHPWQETMRDLQAHAHN